MAEISAGDAKLVQYLNEAYGLEARLETSLEAHAAMTPQGAYRKRLKQHLSETKRHSREVKKRIKQLGGVAATIDAPGPAQVGEAAQAVLSGAQKAAALAQGPLHALRGTGDEEKQLKNAKTEYASESEEIATYTAIETLAEVLGDKDTQRLARSIRREEERMHVHLSCPDGEAKFWIEPILALAGHTGLPTRELKRMQVLVEEHHAEIVRAWKKHFGD